MTNKTVTLKKNSVSSIESKRNQKKVEGEARKLSFGFEMKMITDPRGGKVKCRMLLFRELNDATFCTLFDAQFDMAT